MRTCLIAFGVLAVFAGCAQNETKKDHVAHEQKQYRTGSNLPVSELGRPEVTSVDRDAMQSSVRPPAPAIRPGS